MTVLHTDDFSSDTSADYPEVTQTLIVSGGVAGAAAWKNMWCYWQTSLNTDNHYAKAVWNYQASTGNKLALRCNGNGASSTGYTIYSYAGGNTVLQSFSGSSETWKATWTTSIASGATVEARVEENNNDEFELFINAASQGTKTDSTYTTGSYAGFGVYNNSGTNTATIDDLELGDFAAGGETLIININDSFNLSEALD